MEALLAAVAAFALVAGSRCLMSLAGMRPFTSQTWIVAVLAAILTLFGPDAEQRRKNREKLANKFKKVSRRSGICRPEGIGSQ